MIQRFILCTVLVFLEITVTLSYSQTAQNLDSPFGIHDPMIPELDKIDDIAAVGAKCVRYAGANGIVWDAIEPQKGIFQWIRQDRLYSDTYNKGIKMFVSTISANKAYGVEHGRLPANMNAYLNFLKKSVERFDGDGIDDAPGSPLIEVWQIENEPDIFWKDSPEDYAILLKESYKVIKQANPNAKIAIAGVGTPAGFNGQRKFYIHILDKLNSLRDNPQDRYFDIFDFHWYPFATDYNYLVESSITGGTIYFFREYVDSIKQTLAKYGYNNIPIFITETAQYSDTPSIPNNAEYHSENRQALFLLKQYIYSIINGVQKIFWVTLTEWYNFGNVSNGVFDNVGLINNSANDGKSHKKLAYYTYKKMVELLEGSDWNNIQTIRESDGIYIFKFTIQSKHIWAAWNDKISGSELITISDINSNRVLVTEAIPKFSSGKDVISYTDAFRKDTLDVINGNVNVALSNIPLLIEGMTVTSIENRGDSGSRQFKLYQNFPNPFNPSAVISWQLAVNNLVSLKIYDMLGREVATLVDEFQQAGIHKSTFNIKNWFLPSSAYFYTLKVGNFVETKKMILLK